MHRTSRHDLTHILHCKDRELLLCVHADHAVAQPAHGQHRLPWRRDVHFRRSAGQICFIITVSKRLSPGQMQVCKHIYTNSVRRGSLLIQWQRCFHCPTIVPLKMTNIHGVGGSQTSSTQIMWIYFMEQCEKLSYIGHVHCCQSVTIRTLNDQQSKFSFVPAGEKKKVDFPLFVFLATRCSNRLLPPDGDSQSF